MNIDKDLIEFCKMNEYPIEDMDECDFKAVENSAGFNCFKLRKEFYDLLDNMGYFKFLDKLINIIEVVIK